MKIEEILREHKKNVTPERVSIFKKMQEFHIFSARDIEVNFPEIPRASIFRAIKLFSQIGVLRRVSLEACLEQYEVNSHTHHHEHMKCESCGKILSFESDFLCKLLTQVAKNHKFKLREHSINLFGKCSECCN
ncbi:transcriptional repressor [Candidatus Gracilibacteria bacterium]|nr:transcriptional repressor [Candidatus Gracilibacteria bacterium]